VSGYAAFLAAALSALGWISAAGADRTRLRHIEPFHRIANWLYPPVAPAAGVMGLLGEVAMPPAPNDGGGE
jgi:hypothetical protein